MAQILSDQVRRLAAANLPDPEKFFHAVVDEVCGKASDLPANLMVEACKSLVQDAISSTKNREELLAFLNASGLGDERSNQLAEVVEVRREELWQRVADQRFRSACPSLRDFDWKLQLAMASQSLSNQRELLVQLQLQTSGADAKSANPCVLEFTLEELDDFIDTLEAVEKKVGQMES